MNRFVVPTLVALLALLFGCSNSQELTQSGKWCATSFPGAKHDAKAISDKLNEAFRRAAPSVSGVQDYLKSMDYEATAALYQVYSDFKGADTHVWYGDYSPTGRPGTDKAEGFRVVAKRNIKDAAGRPRLALVITFWTVRNGKLRLVGGPDAMRVRVQIGAETPASSRGEIFGLSYHLDVNEAGKVTAVKPTEFIDAAGKEATTLPDSRIRAITPTHDGEHCFYCHSQSSQRNNFTFSGKRKPGAKFSDDVRDDIVDETLVTAAQHEGVKKFVNSFTTDERTQLEKKFETPKETFYPEGLLESLVTKCNVTGTPPKN